MVNFSAIEAPSSGQHLGYRTHTPAQNVDRRLHAVDADLVTHPRLRLDLVCVADLATWRAETFTFMSGRDAPKGSTAADLYGSRGSVGGAYLSHTPLEQEPTDHSTPIGMLISDLTQRLAWEDASLRGLAEYYRAVDITGPGDGPLRLWPSSVYSEAVRARCEATRQWFGASWDEWAFTFPS